MPNTMENNKAVKMLKAAEEGGYGVIGVVSVRSLHLAISHAYHTVQGLMVFSTTSKP